MALTLLLRRCVVKVKPVDRVLPVFLLVSGVCVWLCSGSAWSSSGGVAKVILQAMAWMVFATGLPLAALSGESEALSRLVRVGAAIQAAFILLSLSFEGIFLFCLQVKR